MGAGRSATLGGSPKPKNTLSTATACGGFQGCWRNTPAVPIRMAAVGDASARAKAAPMPASTSPTPTIAVLTNRVSPERSCLRKASRSSSSGAQAAMTKTEGAVFEQLLLITAGTAAFLTRPILLSIPACLSCNVTYVFWRRVTIAVYTLSVDGGSESQELRLLRANYAAAPGSDAFVALAQHLCDVGRPEEAEQVCRKALVNAGPDHRGRLVLARALADRGRVKEAQDVLAELAKHRTDDAEVWVQLSALVVRRGEKARALALLEYAESLGACGPAFAAALSQARGGSGPRNNTMPPAIPKQALRLRSTPLPDDRPRPVKGELVIRAQTPPEPTILVPSRRVNQVWLVAGALSALAIATAWMLLHG